MTRRTSDENEIAVQAIRLGRAFAEAFAQLPLPRAPADRQLLDDWLERLRQCAPFDERDARAIDEMKSTLIENLDSFAPRYGALVFSCCSDEIPSADPGIEAVRRATELFKRYCAARQELLDRIEAARLVTRLYRAV